ncbi:unnamed protein product [Musa hybrid cultivar]
MAVRGERRGDERHEVKAGGAREESLSPSSAVKANVHPVVSPQGASNLHVDPTLEASHPCFVIPADSIREESSSSSSSSASKRFVFLWFAPHVDVVSTSSESMGISDSGLKSDLWGPKRVMDVCNAAPLCARNKDRGYWNDDNLCVQYPGFSSDVALLDEQPLLLDDLLTEPEISPGGSL